MNLALEYLIRTKAIRNFFDTPSSLFIERGRDKAVITFNRNVNEIHISLWEFIDISVDSLFPVEKSKVIPKDDIFNYNVVPDGYSIFAYHEEPVDTELNTYKKPMTDEMYHWFVDQMLYTSAHKYFKEDWLWDIFSSNLMKEEFEKYSDKFCLLAKLEENDFLNKTWKSWKETFMIDKNNKAACELIFLSSNPECNQLWVF